MTSARTSLTHPLQIATLTAGESGGKIGLSLCPGKRQDRASSGSWRRDLDVDLDAVAAWGAAVVVTLLEDHEFASLGVERLGAGVEARSMRWMRMPIPDAGLPGDLFHLALRCHRDDLIAHLFRGEAVFVHCMGGCGRAGMVSCLLLVECGEQPGVALSRVRAERACAVETKSQEKWVLRLSRGRLET